MVVAVCGSSGHFCFEQGGVFDLLVGDQRADDQMVAFFGDRVEAGNSADVDDVGRFRQAHFHERQQALAAGENFYIVAMFGKKFTASVSERGA